MHSDVLILFIEVMFTMACVAGIVLWILRREYLPEIKQLEQEHRADAKLVSESVQDPGLEEGR